MNVQINGYDAWKLQAPEVPEEEQLNVKGAEVLIPFTDDLLKELMDLHDVVEEDIYETLLYFDGKYPITVNIEGDYVSDYITNVCLSDKLSKLVIKTYLD